MGSGLAFCLPDPGVARSACPSSASSSALTEASAAWSAKNEARPHNPKPSRTWQATWYETRSRSSGSSTSTASRRSFTARSSPVPGSDRTSLPWTRWNGWRGCPTTSPTRESIGRSRTATMPTVSGVSAPPSSPGAQRAQDKPAKKRRGGASWARLISKVFHVDPLKCRDCGGPLRIVAYVTDQLAIDKILDHLGLSPPEQPRPPPEVRYVPVDDEGRELPETVAR